MAKTRKGYRTLAEFHAELKAEGKWDEYIARRKQQDDAVQRMMEKYARAEEPVVRASQAAGAKVNSIWDLVNTKQPYPALVPILFAHLDGPYPFKVREGIIRALAVRESRPYWDELVRRYLAETDESDNGMKWLLHQSIAAAADASVLDTLIKLAIDRRHGRHRALFVDALARIKTPLAKAALTELANDPDLAWEFKRVFRKPRKKSALR
jgi:hypothetical protein